MKNVCYRPIYPNKHSERERNIAMVWLVVNMRERIKYWNKYVFKGNVVEWMLRS